MLSMLQQIPDVGEHVVLDAMCGESLDKILRVNDSFYKRLRIVGAEIFRRDERENLTCIDFIPKKLIAFYDSSADSRDHVALKVEKLALYSGSEHDGLFVSSPSNILLMHSRGSDYNLCEEDKRTLFNKLARL